MEGSKISNPNVERSCDPTIVVRSVVTARPAMGVGVVSALVPISGVARIYWRDRRLEIIKASASVCLLMPQQFRFQRVFEIL